MATTAAKSSAGQTEQQHAVAVQRIQTLRSEMQGIATKIGELESDAEEHRAVIDTLRETAKTAPERTCFRMIGGILVERTVRDVLPALETNMNGLRTVIEGLAKQYKGKDDELQNLSKQLKLE